MQTNAIATPETRAAKAAERAHEASQAMRDAVAEATRVNANTDRLKTLRLARDAREAADLAANPPAKKAKKAAPKKKAAAKSIPVEKLSAANDA